MRTETRTQRMVIYIANDGREFTSAMDCNYYEQKRFRPLLDRTRMRDVNLPARGSVIAFNIICKSDLILVHEYLEEISDWQFVYSTEDCDFECADIFLFSETGFDEDEQEYANCMSLTEYRIAIEKFIEDLS